MPQRLPASVYWRRRALALALVLTPVLLLLRACGGDAEPAASPTPAATSAAETTTTAAKKAKTTPKPETTTATKKAKPSKTATPTIGDCDNGDIQVTITADAESYAIGSPVTMAMRITNTGTVACKRDVGALANEVYVTDVDGAVVWSSDACQQEAKPQVATMPPGLVFGNSQVWGGQNSGRDCLSAAAAAPDATAGTYLAYARNDSVVSKPFAFTIS